ncbi:MAG: hypothetical protein ACYTXF_35965 [Nostoc sp.]
MDVIAPRNDGSDRPNSAQPRIGSVRAIAGIEPPSYSVMDSDWWVPR